MSRESNRLQGNEKKVGSAGGRLDHTDKKASGRTATIFAALAMVLWIEGIIAAYFWIHKPWPGGQNNAPLMALLDLLLAVTLIALAGGIGRSIFRSKLPFSQIENITLQVALGMGIIGFVIFAAGLIGFLGTWQAWLVLGMAVLIFCKPVFAWFGEWRLVFDGSQRLGAVEKVARWLVVFLVVIAGFQALAPPLKWDSLVYHLELPQRYLEMGKLFHLSDNLFSGFPQLSEMIFTWAAALRSGSTAATLGWIVGVLAILGLGGFAARKVGKEFQWIAPAFLLTGASIARGLSWAYVDLWVLLFGLATIIFLDQYSWTKKTVWVGLSAVFAGFAFSTKYTAGMILPIGVVYLIVVWIHSCRAAPPPQRSWKPLLISVLIFISISVMIVIPWFAKNAVMTGNPVYPFFFDGKDMDDLRLSFYQGEMYEQTIFDPLLLPIESTILGIEGGPKFNTSISPLFLALIPGVILGWRYFPKEKRKNILGLAVMVFSTWFIWAVGSQVASALTRTRHYYVIFPALVILSSYGYDYARQLKIGSVDIGWLVQRLIIVVFILAAIAEALFFAKASPIRVLSGFQTEEDYLTEQLGWFGLVMNDVNSLPEGSNVAMFWEPRSYYCVVSCSPDVILDRWWYLMRTVGDASEVVSLLRAQGFTHVLIYDFGVQLVRDKENMLEPEDWEELERFREEELRVFQQYYDAYTLYKIPADIYE